MASNHFDVVIIGAGLSGIGAASHLERDAPNKTYAILESRSAMGGTWDLFRYPGVRSDSDMHTLGYSFKPWKHERAIADGPAILDYIRETAKEYDVAKHIRYNQRASKISWDSASATWTISIKQEGKRASKITCNFIYSCTGYYNYEKGYTPDFEGVEQFKGQIVHPQQWPEDLDYSGKNVVVIGSGATAITVVPSMAKTAKHVTMLQRSPTYVVSRPSKDKFALKLARYLPANLAYLITRWKNVSMQALIYQYSRRRPEKMKAALLSLTRKELGGKVDVDTHFNPSYNPWDQRLCLVPDGDLFRSLRKGTSSVVTGHIKTFTKTGIKLESGDLLKADLVVSATGLELLPMGGMAIEVDGKLMSLPDTLGFRGMMLSDIPNFVLAAGYTNASWTLKCDLTSEYVCRMLNHMDKKGFQYCVARNLDPNMERVAFLDLASGYVDRSIDSFPKQGTRSPWKLYQNYLLDIISLRFGSMQDKEMEYGRAKT
ncbi:NAD(P)/FAD-dependent oxidoreductase [Porticoccaceae bacterium]|jgi:cation diffusion facilitator CzcD-associated flavoprotein CzcO|nr:NAD(P)/FAD-dependent oxidoreductase [Porticoccaceae bacterium]|tara:strand:- start:731 stop:2191 length:1461 start_codon:yes stop_codon:yes gene_type:complete